MFEVKSSPIVGAVQSPEQPPPPLPWSAYESGIEKAVTDKIKNKNKE